VDDTISLIKQLQEEQVEVLAIEQAEGAFMLNEFMPKKDKTYAVVFGNEVKGVQQEVVSASDGIIEIPQLGSKHSLNIAVSTGVVLWDLFSKISSKK
jgi:tRNA G18 (ribose-2'-O)-methylase SpoU